MPIFERVLFFGIGGGNDIFSTTLAMASLWKLGWRWDECAIAGIISPFHEHTVVETDIPGVYETKPDSKRLLLRKDAGREIKFVDSKVSEMISTEKAENIYNANRVLALSIKNGSKGLQESLRRLAFRYDFMVLVDLGGDFFYRGNIDWHILSPLFDCISLRAAQGAKFPCVLFEAGPGTDGELDPEALNIALGKYAHDACSLEPEIMDWWEMLYTKWIKDYRPGRTNEMTIQAFRETEPYLTVPYRVRAHLIDGGVNRQYYRYFSHRIETELCRWFYLIDPCAITKNPFLVSCENAKDWFYKTQVMKWRTNNEANLEYLEEDGKLAQFLTPSPLLHEADRMALIKTGLRHLEDGIIEKALIFPQDMADAETGFWEFSGAFQTRDRGGIIELARR